MKTYANWREAYEHANPGEWLARCGEERPDVVISPENILLPNDRHEIPFQSLQHTDLLLRTLHYDAGTWIVG